MPNQQPVITDAGGRRMFACSPIAVLAVIVREDERILLLAHPKRQGAWEVVNGALEAEETLLEGVLREIREEVGPAVRAHPLGTVHAFTFYYDEHVQYLLSVCYLLAYDGGEVQPGDDMRGSQARWWGLDELADESVRLIVPRDQKWLLQRAVELYRLWKDQSVDLQPSRDPLARTKYDYE
jgi:ADP-ribose pyrophosphatase YjhB (NUDIX family)